SCSPSNPCSVGCCGNGGMHAQKSIFTMFTFSGPDFCGTSCVANCDYKAECNPGGWDPIYVNASSCPLKVCCSRFGFCGTTEEFCGSSQVPEPFCDGNSAAGRIVGYYEGWSEENTCETFTPDQIPLGIYTHINYAFASIDPSSFQVVAMDSFTGTLYPQIIALKGKDPGLKIWISIGGWSFNDPGPTANTFSTLASSIEAQNEFFASLISFMSNYGFDGVDLDWEYPVAPERGGNEADFANLPTFLRNLRNALNSSGFLFGLSITLPSSYWYMRNFDIVSIDPIVDWFNIMTYDLHGTWDGTDPYIGAVALAHTNLTEINQTMDLLWRNNINPARVNMGIGFYGRSFTMSDPSCLKAGCPFSGGGNPGPCTASAGILSYQEIEQIIAAGATVTLDPVAAIEIVTWDTNQWVSYDDTQTLKMKMEYANGKCIGGVLVWAADLDDQTGSAINALGAAL
ncbi:glycoside hydrolase family 18 protein, partial [Hyaloscypha bicolor E]